jgi:hypothetical protein
MAEDVQAPIEEVPAGEVAEADAAPAEDELDPREARLLERFLDAVRPELDKTFRGVQGQRDLMQRSVGEAIGKLEARLEEQRGDNPRTARLLERMARETWGDEAYERWAAEQAKDEELAQLRRQPAQTPKAVEPDVHARIAQEWQAVHGPLLLDYCEERKLDLSKVQQQVPFVETFIAPNDPTGWIGYNKAFKAEADKQYQASRRTNAPARAQVDTRRSAGGGAGDDQELVNKYGRGEYLEPADRLRAVKAMREKGLLSS